MHIQAHQGTAAKVQNRKFEISTGKKIYLFCTDFLGHRLPWFELEENVLWSTAIYIRDKSTWKTARIF